VYRLGPNHDRKIYKFANGRELVGKEMMLEIEELNGPRFLHYRFVATAESEPLKEATEPGKPNDSLSPLASADSND
jgi:hypothetical protein